MTGPVERVLTAFLSDPAAPRYGYDLMKAARLPSGTLYPLLARLEQQKLVGSAWETPQQEGERPRKYYRLTGEGVRIARLSSRGPPPAASARPPDQAARYQGAWDEREAAVAAPRRVPGAPGLPRLPQEIREEHYREWAAELPAILPRSPGPARAVARGPDAGRIAPILCGARP